MTTSIKRLAAYQLHGNLTPTWFSCDRPHCLRRLHDRKSLITLGLWLNGSIIVPITGHRPTGSCPVVIAGCGRSLAVKQTEVKTMCPFVVLHRQIMAQPLKWLLLITKVMGKYLMDGYSVVKGQTRF